ncbi:MAG: glycoside hydrolase family 3 N-terminal domain-containing protein [Beutenbergiaceae bacterium]
MRRALAVLVAGTLAAGGCAEEPNSPISEPEQPAAAATTPAPTQPPEPRLAWGPTEAELQQAMADAAELSDEAAAGQVIVARYDGTEPATAAQLVTDYHLGGVILFSQNIASLDQVSATSAAVQEAVAATRQWPAMVAVDNEGGLVQRLSGDVGPWTSYPPLLSAGAASDAPDVITAAYQAMAAELVASGITTNFAPVADVTVGPSDVTIGTRSAGSDPQRVAQVVVAASAGFSAGGVLSSVKHFPGHGSLNVDSHLRLPVLDTPTAELVNRDLVPFAAGVDAGSPMVMVGHIAVTDWDPDVPATLSPAAYSYLRDQLGFTGVAVTDALDMGALTATWSSEQIAVMALNAGADLLLVPGDVAAAHGGIMDALADGTLSRDRLTQAAGRVIAMLRWQRQLAAAATPAPVGSAGPAAQALAAAAITMVAGQCSAAVVGGTVRLQGGTASERQLLTTGLTAAGVDVVDPAQTLVVLADRDWSGGSADVVVALDSPYVLTGARADTVIAAYSDTPTSLNALVAVLTGSATATGRLPVTVGDLPASVC